MTKQEKKYNALIGCQTYLNEKTGKLIIVSSGKVYSLETPMMCCGMFVGLTKSQGKTWLVVTYNGLNRAIYLPKHSKII